jgi:gamma-glutamylcyclotransferase (GGCT)/AIG2-like uncharacterized protein YtfP
MDLTKKGTPLKAIKRKDLKPLKHDDEPVIVKDNFVAEFLAVYGTLRVGQGNWKRYLRGNTLYIDTQEWPGWYWAGGLAAGYSGNPEHSLVVDIFQVDPARLEKINRPVDALEGCSYENDWGYQPCAAPAVLTPGTQIWNDNKELILLDNDMVVLTKSYPVPGSTPHGSDRLAPMVKDLPEQYKSHVGSNHPANGHLFTSFYNL